MRRRKRRKRTNSEQYHHERTNSWKSVGFFINSSSQITINERRRAPGTDSYFTVKQSEKIVQPDPTMHPIGTTSSQLDDMSILADETDMMSEMVKIGIKKFKVRDKVNAGRSVPTTRTAPVVVDEKRRKLDTEDISRRWPCMAHPSYLVKSETRR